MSEAWAKATGAAVLLFLADRVIAHVCVSVNAAGALLSPSGASLEAVGLALAFLTARLGLVACVALAAGLGAARLVNGRGERAGDRRRARTRPRDRRDPPPPASSPRARTAGRSGSG